MEINEKQIIAACQAGQLDQFGRLYDRYIKKIYNFIYYKTNHRETAEDLTSQTFIKAMEKINQFNLAKGTFSAWLYQIARNTVIDNYRKSKPSVDINDVWDLQTDDDIQRDIDAVNKLREVDQYLQQLKPQQREIVILRVWENLSYQEIAEIIGKTSDSCKMMFFRTIKELKNNVPLAIYLLFLSQL